MLAYAAPRHRRGVFCINVPLPSVSIGDRYKLRHAIEVRQPKQEEIASARKGVGEDARQAHGRPRSQCRLILTSYTRNHPARHARDARNLRRIQSALGEDPYTSVSLRPRTRPNYKWSLPPRAVRATSRTPTPSECITRAKSRQLSSEEENSTNLTAPPISSYTRPRETKPLSSTYPR